MVAGVDVEPSSTTGGPRASSRVLLLWVVDGDLRVDDLLPCILDVRNCPADGLLEPVLCLIRHAAALGGRKEGLRLL
jgi:hypothetical protein